MTRTLCINCLSGQCLWKTGSFLDTSGPRLWKLCCRCVLSAAEDSRRALPLPPVPDSKCQGSAGPPLPRAPGPVTLAPAGPGSRRAAGAPRLGGNGWLVPPSWVAMAGWCPPAGWQWPAGAPRLGGQQGEGSQPRQSWAWQRGGTETPRICMGSPQTPAPNPYGVSSAPCPRSTRTLLVPSSQVQTESPQSLIPDPYGVPSVPHPRSIWSPLSPSSQIHIESPQPLVPDPYGVFRVPAGDRSKSQGRERCCLARSAPAAPRSTPARRGGLCRAGPAGARGCQRRFITTGRSAAVGAAGNADMNLQLWIFF